MTNVCLQKSLEKPFLCEVNICSYFFIRRLAFDMQGPQFEIWLGHLPFL